MRLNAQTDFSLRFFMYLATKESGSATIQEMASRMGLSQSHMMRVTAKLAASGLVVSSRGRSGGISLGKEATDITVEDIVRAIEPDFALVQCFDPSKEACPIEPACLLKGVLASAVGAFFAELRSVSLAQLVQPNKVQLTQIFRLDSPGAEKVGNRVRGRSLSGRIAEGGFA